MYDTIKIQLPYAEAETESLNATLNTFDNVTDKRYRNTGIVTTQATFNNWKFSQSPKSLTAYGSLPQLLYKTNQLNFTREETIKALSKLQDIIGLDISAARVTRIDFGCNIVVDHPVDTYFKLLCNRDLTKRWTVSDETLYFKGRVKELCFYNKSVQLRDTYQPLHEQYFYKNLLRYEMKLTKEICKITDYPEINCATLTDKRFYNKLVKLWHDEYQLIDKLSFVVPADYGKNWTEFRNYLTLEGIEKNGGSETFDLVNDKKAFKLDHRAKHNIKKMLKKLISSKVKYHANDALDELNEKMFNILQNAA
jgi:hypothetical protein